MTQILLVLNDFELSTIIHRRLSQKYELEVIVMNSSSEVTSLLEILPEVGIILCRDFIGKDPLARKLSEFLVNKKLDQQIQLIIMGNVESPCSKSVCIDPYAPYEKICDLIGYFAGKEPDMVPIGINSAKPGSEITSNKKKVEPEVTSEDVEGDDDRKTTVFKLQDLKNIPPLEEAPKEEEQIKVHKYIPMNIIYFMNLPEVSIDFSVYARVKKSDTFEYHEKFHSNSKISRLEIERLLVRSGKDLYVDQEEIKKASSFLNGIFLKRFEKTDMSWSERLKLNSDCFEILLDVFKNSSFDKYNVQIIKEIISSMNLMVKAPDALKIFLAALAEKKVSYGYTNSHMCFYLFLMIVDHFSWSKDQSKNKLLYLSLFHDLSLHSDRLIKLHHDYFHESKNMTEEEKEIVLNHAEASAHVLEHIVKAPHELTTLIKEHHGLKSGKGFIESLSIAISPTSMAFIVIEDFVTHYLSALEKMETDKASGPPKTQLEMIFSELKNKYDRLTYADVLSELQKVMIKK